MGDAKTEIPERLAAEFPPVANRSLLATLLGASLGAGFFFAAHLAERFPAFSACGVVGKHWINLLTFIAFGAAVSLLLARALRIRSERRAFALGLLGDDQEALVLPEDALECRKRLGQLQPHDRRLLLVKLLHAGLQRARANWSAEDAGQAIRTQAELLHGQTDSEYSLVRYLIWAIPSLGFIGTVLGIGKAMGAMSVKGNVSEDASNLGKALDATIAGATGHLAMAFDTTFVALVLSLIVMYLLHRVQSQDDSFLVRATDWCMHRFVFRMHIRREQQS